MEKVGDSATYYYAGEDNDNLNALSSSSRKRKATTTTTATQEEDDEFTAATKKILTTGLGEKGVVSKIMSDVSDYIRLDDLEEIKSITTARRGSSTTTTTTTGDGVKIICAKLEKYYKTNDEEFVIVALEKLWNYFFDDRCRLTENQRKQNDQEIYQSNGHNLIIECMSLYPNNSKIQECGCHLLGSIGKYGLKGDDMISFIRFLVSKRTMTVISSAVKNYITTTTKKANEKEEEEAAKIVGLSLMVLAQSAKLSSSYKGGYFCRQYFENLESLDVISIAFEAIQRYPTNSLVTELGMYILHLAAVRLNKPVLRRLVNEKTRNVFDRVIDHAVQTQSEMNSDTNVSRYAEMLRLALT